MAGRVPMREAPPFWVAACWVYAFGLPGPQGFVIYPGKLTAAPCFRIGCIGDLHPADCQALVDCVGDVVQRMGLRLK